MKINLFQNLGNNLKPENKVRTFINELEHELENKEIPILEEIENKRHMSKAYKNTIKMNIRTILKKCAEESKQDIFFVHDKLEQNLYNVYKYGKEKIETIKLESLPKEAGVNSILKLKGRDYVLDVEATKKVNEEIEKMANDLLDKQDAELEIFRKEGHLYMVEEKINDKIFLCDLNNKEQGALEEVEFPQEQIEIAEEGMVFKYENGTYKYHSNDGFERIYEE